MKSAAHFALWIKSTKYLSFISQGRQQEIKCLVKSKRICSLWDGFYVLSSHHYLSPPSSHRRSSAMHVHAGVCVCLHYGRVSHPRKADGRCATQLGNFPPKTVGLLPVHLLRLNQPQSATYFLKCLQSWLTVRVTLSVCVFDVCECLYLSFCCLIMSLSSNAFPLRFLTVAKPFHDHAEGLIQFLLTVFNLFSVFFKVLFQALMDPFGAWLCNTMR